VTDTDPDCRAALLFSYYHAITVNLDFRLKANFSGLLHSRPGSPNAYFWEIGLLEQDSDIVPVAQTTASEQRIAKKTETHAEIVTAHTAVIKSHEIRHLIGVEHRTR